jgi:broad specificity phosphatase PhoE
LGIQAPLSSHKSSLVSLYIFSLVQVWNVLRSQYPSKEERYIDALYAPDCDVTEEGVGQSVQAGRELRKALHQDKEGGAVDPNVVFIVSPLRRALQTAQHMLQGGDGDGWQPDQTRVHPLAAEILQDPCDIGTPVEDLAQEFPHFDFRLVRKAAASGYWWAYHRSVEETWRRMKGGLTEGVEPPEEIVTRMTNLKRYVCEDCSEADVVVLVCHSETIWWLSSRQGSDGSLYGIWTANGEIVDLTDCMRLDKGEERVMETPPALDDRNQRFDVFLT